MQRIRFVVVPMVMGLCVSGQEKPVDLKTVHATPVVLPKVQAAALNAMDLSNADWRFAHPRPDLLASINVGNIARSPLLAESLRESFPAGSDRAKIDTILRMAGAVDRVQVSIQATQVKDDPDVLVLLTGDLDNIMLRMLTQPSKGSTMVAREVAPNAILFGKASVIDQAARRMSEVTATVIATDQSSNDLWISGDAGPLKGSMSSVSALPPAIDTLKHFALGLNFRDPVELNINLSMLDEGEAGKMMAMYNLLASQAAQIPDAAALASATKVDQQGPEIHFRFSAPVAMLQAQLNSSGVGNGPGVMAGLLGLLGMSSAAHSAAPATAAPATSEKPGKIMIYLDDGPKQVGAPKKQEKQISAER